MLPVSHSPAQPRLYPCDPTLKDTPGSQARHIGTALRLQPKKEPATPRTDSKHPALASPGEGGFTYTDRLLEGTQDPEYRGAPSESCWAQIPITQPSTQPKQRQWRPCGCTVRHLHQTRLHAHPVSWPSGATSLYLVSTPEREKRQAQPKAGARAEAATLHGVWQVLHAAGPAAAGRAAWGLQDSPAPVNHIRKTKPRFLNETETYSKCNHHEHDPRGSLPSTCHVLKIPTVQRVRFWNM